MKYLRLKWKWIVAALVLAGFLSSEGTRSYWQKKRALGQLKAKLEEWRLTNRNLALEIKRIKSDPAVIEQIARRDLGLIQPGEIEYRFIVKSSSKDHESR